MIVLKAPITGTLVYCSEDRAEKLKEAGYKPVDEQKTKRPKKVETAE